MGSLFTVVSICFKSNVLTDDSMFEVMVQQKDIFDNRNKVDISGVDKKSSDALPSHLDDHIDLTDTSMHFDNEGDAMLPNCTCSIR